MHIGSKLVKAGDLGLGGFLYGGRLLEYLAEQSAIYAMKSTGEPHLLGYRAGATTILSARCVFVAVGPDGRKKAMGGDGGERKNFEDGTDQSWRDDPTMESASSFAGKVEAATRSGNPRNRAGETFD